MADGRYHVAARYPTALGESIPMTGVAEAESALRRWKPLYGPIAAELDRCEELLRRELSSDDPFVDELIKHAFRLGGKRLRPALLLLPPKPWAGPTRNISRWPPWSK